MRSHSLRLGLYRFGCTAALATAVAMSGHSAHGQVDQFNQAPAGQQFAPQPIGQQPAAIQPAAQPVQPGFGAAPVAAPATGMAPLTRIQDVQPAPPGVHPLTPAVEIANLALRRINSDIADYTCTVVKRERIGSKLGDPEYMYAKVRHNPFSVYLRFLGPESVKDQEVVYVAGRNDGNMIAHAGSGIRARFGSVSLSPTSVMAMSGNRYPITELGIMNLTRRLIEVGNNDMKYGECTVEFNKGAKVMDRSCTVIRVNHPVPRKNFLFNEARIYVDDELQIPIRYEAYDWPRAQGEAPQLTEEYTYLNVKLNVGLTDADFDPRNPQYRFNVK